MEPTQPTSGSNGIPDPKRPPIPNHPLAPFFDIPRSESWDAIWEEVRLNREKEKAELALLYPEAEDE